MSPPLPDSTGAGAAAAGDLARGPRLTAPALRVLEALARDGGTASHGRLSGLAGVPPKTAYNVTRRLTAAGWLELVPAADHRTRAVRLTPLGRAAARDALAAARRGTALARAALGPVSAPVPVPPGSREPGPGESICRALLIRALLGSPGQPCRYAELAARTGIPSSTLRSAVAGMRAAGWVTDVRLPAPPGAAGRPPKLVALTPDGHAAAPSVLAAARSRLARTARDLGGPRNSPVPPPVHAAARPGGRAPAPTPASCPGR